MQPMTDADGDDSERRQWTEEQNFRQWCCVCDQFELVCCGDETNGWYCRGCCPHPYFEAR